MPRPAFLAVCAAAALPLGLAGHALPEFVMDGTAAILGGRVLVDTSTGMAFNMQWNGSVACFQGDTGRPCVGFRTPTLPSRNMVTLAFLGQTADGTATNVLLLGYAESGPMPFLLAWPHKPGVQQPTFRMMSPGSAAANLTWASPTCLGTTAVGSDSGVMAYCNVLQSGYPSLVAVRRKGQPEPSTWPLMPRPGGLYNVLAPGAIDTPYFRDGGIFVSGSFLPSTLRAEDQPISTTTQTLAWSRPNGSAVVFSLQGCPGGIACSAVQAVRATAIPDDVGAGTLWQQRLPWACAAPVASLAVAGGSVITTSLWGGCIEGGDGSDACVTQQDALSGSLLWSVCDEGMPGGADGAVGVEHWQDPATGDVTTALLLRWEVFTPLNDDVVFDDDQHNQPSYTYGVAVANRSAGPSNATLLWNPDWECENAYFLGAVRGVVSLQLLGCQSLTFPQPVIGLRVAPASAAPPSPSPVPSSSPAPARPGRAEAPWEAVALGSLGACALLLGLALAAVAWHRGWCNSRARLPRFGGYSSLGAELPIPAADPW